MACTMEWEIARNWLVAVDPANCGVDEEWYRKPCKDAQGALFPGFVQDTIPEYQGGAAWFWNQFRIDSVPVDSDSFLKIGFSEFVAQFWLNGEYLGRFDGKMLFYELACTAALKRGENLLAIRIVAPDREEIDGYTWLDVSGAASGPNRPPLGGIRYPIRLVFRPKVRIETPVVRANVSSGTLEIEATVHGKPQKSGQLSWSVSVISPSGECILAKSQQALAPDRAGRIFETLQIEKPHLWTPDDPYLYVVILNLFAGGNLKHTVRVRTGYRELRVGEDGWFYLNGRRVCSKAVSNCDGWLPMGANLKISDLRKEIVHMKAMGFNTFRYHNCCAFPEILDLCDELGMMVIEAHAYSWQTKAASSKFEELYDLHLQSTIRHDRNHPCIVAWELINECHFARERDHAVQAIKLVRELDKTRLVYLGSGRWDNEFSVGSISNPNSNEWSCVWGCEDPNAPKAERFVKTCRSHPALGKWTDREDDLCCWNDGIGDVHIYPRIPMTFRGKYALRHHNENAKPCIISESGTSSLGNCNEMIRMIEQSGAMAKNERVTACREIGEFFDCAFYHYHLDDIYSFPENLIQDSYRQLAYQRGLIMDLIRANPKVAGFCVCQSSTPYLGFGMLDWFRNPLPYVTEGMRQSIAPLHWCLFVDPEHVYVDRPFTVEAVLASEDVLEAGTYKVIARITSKERGCVWEKRTELVLPELQPGELRPWCFEVLKEELSLTEPGQYVYSVLMEHGGAPTGGYKEFSVSADETALDRKVCVIGLSTEQVRWLTEHGITNSEASEVVLVGDSRMRDSEFEQLLKKAETGSTVILLRPEILVKDENFQYTFEKTFVPERLPVARKGVLRFTDNWAYRTHTILKKHAYADNLPVGLLNDSYWGLTEPIFVLEDADDPDEAVAITLAAPYMDKNGDETHGSLAGIAMGTYRYGRGKIVVNCFRIFEELDSNPAAGRLLMNMLRF